MVESIGRVYEEIAIITKNTGIITGMLFIMYGVILLSRKNILIHNFYFPIILFFSLLMPDIIGLFKVGDIKLAMIIIMISIVIIFFIGRREYLINNVNKQMITSTLKDILEEKNISYEVDKYKIILKDYGTHIWYNQSLDSVQISFRLVSHLDFYTDLKMELKRRIKEIDSMLFPWNGILVTGIGISLIVFIKVLDHFY